MKYDKRKALWERQKGETPRAYAQFCLYRDYGVSRSLDTVFGKNAKTRNSDVITIKIISRDQAGKICGNNEWPKRTAAYDDYTEKQVRRENEKALIKMRKKYAALGNLSGNFGGIAMKLIFERLQKQADEGNLDLEKLGELSHRDIQNYIKDGMAAERFGLGDTEKTVEQTNVDKPDTQNEKLAPINMNKEEKRQLADMINNAKNREK